MASIENVMFRSSDAVSLNAKLYSPSKVKSKYPAVLIIEGSGKSGFEAEPKESPFNQLAIRLSNSGFFVMKYNKRGSGENSTNGSFWKSTFSSDNIDAQNALNYLKSKNNIDQKRIFLIGHSFGGPHSILLSLKHSIAGIVMLTSTIQPTSKLMHDQNKIIMDLQGVPEKDQISSLSDLDAQLNNVKNKSYKCIEPSCSLIDSTPIMDKSIQIPWLQEVLNLNFLELAKEQKSNMLFIFGNSDFVIPLSEQSFVNDNLIKLNPVKYKMKIINPLDHFMVENKNKMESLKYAQGLKKEKKFKVISNDLVTTIIEWIKNEKSNN